MFIPKEKLSKKAKRLQDNAVRQTWGSNPVTRVKKSKKTYKREKPSHWYDGNGAGVFLYPSYWQPGRFFSPCRLAPSYSLDIRPLSRLPSVMLDRVYD